MARRLVAAGLLSAAAACADSGVVTSSYASVREARAAGAVARGWIPEGLPEGATDLRAAHDLDSARRWGLFSFPQSDAPAVRRLLRSDEAALEGVRIDIPGRIEWWPVLLRGSLEPDQVRGTGLRAHEAVDGTLLFLVNWEQGRAYYWTRPES